MKLCTSPPLSGVTESFVLDPYRSLPMVRHDVNCRLIPVCRSKSPSKCETQFHRFCYFLNDSLSLDAEVQGKDRFGLCVFAEAQ